jgi:pimeloyl-ACP methyl ester carboxylesterase
MFAVLSWLSTASRREIFYPDIVRARVCATGLSTSIALALYTLGMNWLLLRGLVREQRHWCDFPVLLEKSTGVKRVITLDLPGVGTEHQRRSPATIRGILTDVRDRFSALRGASPERDEPWGLLGVSLGGMVTLAWCQTFGDDFSRAVVINTSASDAGHPLERFRPAGLKTIIASLRDRDLQRRERRTIDLTVNRADLDRDELARTWAAYALDAPISPTTMAAQLTAATRWRAPRAVSTPVLILASHGDRLVDPSCSWRIATHLGAPISIHPWAGHDLPRDDARWVLEQIATTAQPR